MTIAAPTAVEQVAFLGNVERLLAEGQFTATYKYALLISLPDLAVEHGHDDCRELDLPVRAIGEKFVELYWRQALPFGAGTITDWTISSRVAAWSYAHADSVNAQVWSGRGQLARLEGRWRDLLRQVPQVSA